MGHAIQQRLVTNTFLAMACKDLDSYIRSIPKVELHAHLNGCIREETLFELARERNVVLSEHHFAAEAPQQQDHSMYNVLPRSLQDCFDMFAEIPACVNDLPSLQRITREALEDFASHGVAYLELRSTPKILLKSAKDSTEIYATKRDYIETILSTIRTFERNDKEHCDRNNNNGNGNEKYPPLALVSRFLVSVDRSQSLQEAQENINLAMEFNRQTNSHNDHPMVVGIDLGGNPTKQDFTLFEPLFTKARSESNLKITLHCAEIPCGNDNDDDDDSPSTAAVDDDDDDDVDDETVHGQKARAEAAAMLAFAPDRIGHALLLPPSLRAVLRTSGIPVETCPTSNVMTLELAKHSDGDLIHGLQQHPALREWLNQGHPLTVATDDPGVFSTTATQELLLLAKAFGLDRSDISRIVTQSMDYAFCDAATKNRVKKSIVQRINELQL